MSVDGELYREIGTRASVAAVALIDADGAVTRWSSGAQRLFGLGAEAVLGRPIGDLLPFHHEAQAPATEAPAEEAEGWCLRADGSTFRARVLALALDGGLGHAILITDVTARHHAAALAQSARERVDRITAALARVVFFSIDIARGEVDASDGLAEIIGWTRGKPPRGLGDLLALLREDERAELERRLERCIAGESWFDYEFRVRADLGERWLSVVGSYLPGDHPRVVGTGMDVTQRRLADDALRASEAKLQAVLDGTVEGILTIAHDGRIESANHTAARMFRCAEADLLGAPWRSFLELPGGGELPAPGVPRELSARRPDGSSFPIECGVSQVDLGARTLALLCLRDITERRLLERKLLDVGEQLRRQIGQDLHDGLGQLLTGTAFLAKGLEGHVSLDYQAQASRVVELINTAIHRVRSLARGLSPIVEAQSLELVLREVVAESSRVLGVDCRLERRDAVETARPATMAQLCLIVREAITNAVRHGHAERIVVSLSRQGERSMLTIEDDGTGIRESPALLEGMGLRSMRQRARMIGGDLEVARAAVGTVVRCWWKE